MNEVFHFLKFQEFNNELGKTSFQLGKSEMLIPLESLCIPQNLWL